MKKVFLIGFGILVLAALLWPAGGEMSLRAAELDEMEVPEPGYSGPLFEPSYDFPASMPAAENRPWESIDFEAEPARYMNALLAYVLEGQNTGRWNVGSNPVRTWYHMPWMGPGGKGREYISGLTSERRSRPFELGPQQDKCRQNWAVGFYNPVGGYVLNRLWAPVVSGAAMKPDFTALPFPEGTVVAKVLYTEAVEGEVPLLAGAPSIDARIVKDETPDDDRCPPDTIDEVPAPRVGAVLRLLQLDIAVRDADADGMSGWVFGTFIYDGRLAGADPWAKLQPVGLMWGNDELLSDDDAAGGKKPAEGTVLSDFGLNRPFGRGGRMNGPVDNPASACLACHMTAQFPSTAGMAPPADATWELARCWFRTLKPTEAFGRTPQTPDECGTTAPDQVALDYSLQLAVGARNVAIANANRDRGGISIFGYKLFQRPLLHPDATVEIDGVMMQPISRDEADQGE